ncbi:MAG: alpha/beta fold hydrolase [Nocardioides sp.]
MFTSSGRARIAYDVAGAEDAAHDVLLLHAGVTDRRSWQALVETLSPRHRCVRYDARGYGETTYQREDGWSPVDDAVAVLEAAGVASAVVVAGSMGGAVALDLALAHPDRVRALVLIGSAVRGAPYPEITEPRTSDLVARADAAEEAADWETLNRLEAWIWLDGPTVAEGRVSGPARELFLEMNDRALRAEDPGARAQLDETWPRLGEIRVPVLVMVGRLDLEDIRAVGEALAEALPEGHLVWLDGVAHLPQLEGDPTTLRAIADFVDGLPAGG